MDDFIWLRHPETGGHFHCPPEAVKAWIGRGWEPVAEPPPEADKTRDEPMLAALHEAQLAEQAGAEDPKPAKSSRRPSAAATEEKE